jgi:ankyrin repeat protein
MNKQLTIINKLALIGLLIALPASSFGMQNVPDDRTSLHVAAVNGNTELTARLLREGVDPDGTMNVHRWTPLLKAVERGHTEVVALLIRAGANVNAVGNNGWTPLFVAAMHGHTEVAIQLLRAGAYVDAADSWGICTPLSLAIDRGNIELAVQLLKAGAKANAVNKLGRTAFHIANLSYAPVDKVMDGIDQLLELSTNAALQDQK